jgi:uncharacterized protein
MSRPNLREIESRTTPFAVELRTQAGSRRIGGYGAVFGKRSQDLGGFREVVEPRAFSKTQGDGWPGVVARFEHKPEMLLGTVAAGTLQLRTDAAGLDYEVDLPDTSAGNDVLALTTRNDIRHSSFAFQVYDQDYVYENGETVRHLTSVRLIDVAPVGVPAYPDASVALRSLAIQMDAPEQDIFDMARRDELRKLFTRSDNRGPQSLTTTKTGRQALIELMALHPSAQRPSRTPAQMRSQLTRMRLPKPRKTVAERRAELTKLARPMYQSAAEVGIPVYDR